MNGGCSNDAFADFRSTLISHGRIVYERALADPDSLSEISYKDGEDICYEGFQYVKNEVAEEKFGEILEREVSLPADPTGEAWDEDSLLQLFPKLAAKYSDVFDSDAPCQDKPWWKFW